MRLAPLAIAILAAVIPAAARAECRDEVTAAFAKQRETRSFRMVANVISAQGPMKMTIDYALPNSIRQHIVFATQPDQPIEAVLIGLNAWYNDGKGWVDAPPEVRAELERQLQDVAQETDDQLGKFDCLGKQSVDGSEVAAYRAAEPPRAKDAPGANETARIIYVDPAKGLPVRTIIARPTALDRPLFKAVYSYPNDIKIEAPAGK